MSKDSKGLPKSQTEDIGSRDHLATDTREENPDTGYSAFFMKRAAASIANGQGHNTLGGNLVRDGESRGDFWDAGRVKANRFKSMMGTDSTSKVIDYGCGSLRLGAHFIDELPKGHFFGLDVTDDFFNMGVDLIGSEIIEAKQPVLRVINQAAVNEAAAFGADGVYSSAVCVHVHPDERGFYFQALQDMAGKSGCHLVFDATVGHESSRYANRSWAMTEDEIMASVPELTFIKKTESKWRDKNGYQVAVAQFEFKRP